MAPYPQKHGEIVDNLRFCSACLLRPAARHAWRKNKIWGGVGKVNGVVERICNSCCKSRLFSCSKEEKRQRLDAVKRKRKEMGRRLFKGL